MPRWSKKFNLRFKDFWTQCRSRIAGKFAPHQRLPQPDGRGNEKNAGGVQRTSESVLGQKQPFGRFDRNHYEPLAGTLVPIDRNDSSDPLWHDAGNPSLKTSREYSLEAVYRFRERNDYMRSIEVSGGYSEWENNFSFGRFYNRETGVTTVRPMNINGTWRAWAKGNYSRLLGKAKRWNISNDLGFSFDHSLDYVSDREAASPIKSAVDNLNVTDHFRVDYRINEMRLGAKADLTWRKQKSLDGRFATNSFTHFNYGVTLSTPLDMGHPLRYGYNGLLPPRLHRCVDEYDRLGVECRIVASARPPQTVAHQGYRLRLAATDSQCAPRGEQPGLAGNALQHETLVCDASRCVPTGCETQKVADE